MWDSGVTQGAYKKFYSIDGMKNYKQVIQEKLVTT